MSQQPFVIERVYNAPVSKVWKALTDNKEMKQWYFDLPDFKAEPGCEFSLAVVLRMEKPTCMSAR